MLNSGLSEVDFYKDPFILALFCLSMLLLVWGFIILGCLIRKRSKFGYKNMSILWQVVYILLLLLILVMLSIDFLFLVLKGYNPFNNSIIHISYLILSYLFMLPNLSRSIFYIKSLQMNYYHLNSKSPNSSINGTIKVMNNNDFNYSYTKRRRELLLKVVLLPITIFTILVAALLSFDYTRCILINLNSFNLNLRNECNQRLFDLQSIQIQISFGLIILVVESGVYMFFITKLLKYPIKKDSFYIIFEIGMIFVIWFISVMFVSYFCLFSHDSLIDSELNLKLKKNGMLLNHCFCMLYFSLFTYLMIKRNSIHASEIDKLLNNFDNFLYNYICFGFFKEYVVNNHITYYKFLEFWLEVNIFKRVAIINCNTEKLPSLQQERNSNYFRSTERDRESDQVGDMNLPNSITTTHLSIYFKQDKTTVENIFHKYFYRSLSVTESVSDNNETENIRQHTRNSAEKQNQSRKLSNNIDFKINFPPSIIENVKKFLTLDFNEYPAKRGTICYIYDDALIFAHNKLYEIYLLLCRDQPQYRNLMNLIYYFEFYDFKEKNNLQRKEMPSNLHDSYFSNI